VDDRETEARWTVAEADRATATGRVPICWWCGVPVMRDGAGGWAHITRAYACRDPRFGWLPHSAQPRPAVQRRVLPVTGRRAI
jgi:hypothetical protein